MIVYYPKKRVGELVITDARATKRVIIGEREKEFKGYGGFEFNDICHPNKQRLKEYLDRLFSQLGFTVDYDDED